MTTDPIKALLGLEAQLREQYNKNYNIRPLADTLHTIIAAIEAIKPLADGTHVVVGSALLNDLRAIADMGGRRIETAMDACDKIIELIDMERQLGPAAPAPSDEGVVERVARAICYAHGYKPDELISASGIQQKNRLAKDFKNWKWFTSHAEAALAAIKEEE